ncbi:MAG: hypothetical protein ACE5JR_11980 [Gemmatimonadota bacterium]
MFWKSSAGRLPVNVVDVWVRHCEEEQGILVGYFSPATLDELVRQLRRDGISYIDWAPDDTWELTDTFWCLEGGRLRCDLVFEASGSQGRTPL